MREIQVNGVTLVIISNTTRLRENMKNGELIPIGADKFGINHFIYEENFSTWFDVIGLDKDHIDSDSPKECWKNNDWCYFDYNTNPDGEPLYKSEIMKRVVEVVRKELRMDVKPKEV